jgi:hypothetical protein
VILYQEEAYSACIEELKAIYPEHYEELAVEKSVPLEPDYDTYLALEKLGKISLITCRKDSELIGYVMFFINTHMHYKSCKVAHEDIYYLKKPYRKGRIGIKLFQYAEQAMREKKIDRIVFGTKVYLDNSKLFEYLGYRFYEKLYTKLL